MKTNKRLIEAYTIDAEVISITSATTRYTKAVCMEGCDEADFIVSLPPTAGAGAGVAITIQQAENATKAESSNAAAVTGASITLGSTVANYVYKARGAVISVSSAATNGETIVINGRTYTCSTANVATSLQFGATAGTTSAGEEAVAGALAALINSTVSSIGHPSLIATTAASVVNIQVRDTASTSITVQTTGGGFVPSYAGAFVKISVKADAMNSTSRYLSAMLSSCATAGNYGVCVLRKGDRAPAKYEHGQLKIHKAT